MYFSVTLPNTRRNSSVKSKSVSKGWKEPGRITEGVAEEVEVATTTKETITMAKIKESRRRRQKCLSKLKLILRHNLMDRVRTLKQRKSLIVSKHRSKESEMRKMMLLLPNMLIEWSLASKVTNRDTTQTSSLSTQMRNKNSSSKESDRAILRASSGYSAITITDVRAGTGTIHSIMHHLQPILLNAIK